MSYTLLTHTPPTRAWHCTGSRDIFVASHAEWRVPRHFSMAARRERSATNGDGLSARHPDSRPIVMLDLMFIERCRHWQLRNQTRGSQLGSTVFCDYTTMYTSRYTLITHTLRLTEPEATRAGARAGMTYCGAKAKKRRLQSRQPCSSKRANCDLRRDTSSITVSATKITAGHTSYACAATDRKKRLIMRRMISFSAGELSRKDPSSW